MALQRPVQTGALSAPLRARSAKRLRVSKRIPLLVMAAEACLLVGGKPDRVRAKPSRIGLAPRIFGN